MSDLLSVLAERLRRTDGTWTWLPLVCVFLWLVALGISVWALVLALRATHA